MRTRVFGMMLVAIATLSGCSRVMGISEARPDGSYTRELRITLAKQPVEGTTPKLEELLLVPDLANLKRTEETKDDNLVVTLRRELNPNAGLIHDFSVRTKSGIKSKNTTLIRDLGDGKFEYVETMSWLGSDRSNLEQARAAMRGLLNEAILPNQFDGPTLDRLAEDVSLMTVRLIFGPNEPLLLTLLGNPDYAERKLRREFGRRLDGLIAARAAGRLSPEERLAITRRFVQKLDTDRLGGGSPQQQAANTEASDPTGLLGITSVLKIPGEYLESNGEFDPISNEVSWSYYVESAQPGPVELRAVWRVKP